MGGEVLWYCCQCGDGGLPPWHTHCPNCFTHRCTGCVTQVPFAIRSASALETVGVEKLEDNEVGKKGDNTETVTGVTVDHNVDDATNFPSAEAMPIEQDQFQFTRSRSIDRDYQSIKDPGHAYAKTPPEETDSSDSSVQDGSEEVDHRPRLPIDHAQFELEEVGSDDTDNGGIETMQPSHLEDARDPHKSAALEATGLMNGMGALYVSEDSQNSEEEAQMLEYYMFPEKKRRAYFHLSKRTHDQHVAGDSGHSDNDAQDYDTIEARRLRRKLNARGLLNRRRNALKSDDNFFKALSGIDTEVSRYASRTRGASVGDEIGNIEDDRRSVQSLDSSTTLISTLRGFTVLELESATAELEKIFQEDADLIRLYKEAIKDTSVGPERLRRNVDRLLKSFARSLRREASQEQEKLACLFVSTKADYIAQCIVEEFNDGPLNKQPRHIERKQEGGDGLETQLHHDTRETEDLDDLAPVEEDIFEDLPMLRSFLVNSVAFQVFRQELSKFVLPKESQSVFHDNSPRKVIPDASLVTNYGISKANRIAKDLLSAVGCLEPPLQPDMIRLRWQCKCGDKFFEDVTEYHAGGISKLIEEMQSSCVAMTAAAYGEAGSQRAYFPGLQNSLRRAWRKISNASNECQSSPRDSSQDINPQIMQEDVEAGSAIPHTASLLLLAGLHRSQRHTYLVQDDVEKVKTDRQLFYFMREQLNGRHNCVQRFFSTTHVKNIHFTKLCLRVGDNLEVRTHDSCCTEQPWSDCDCIPPASRVEGGQASEYRCNPAGPPKRWPPVLSRYLVHRLEDPSCVHKDDKTVLQKIPRRICGEIHAENEQEAEGWGIYYEEGPNVLWVAVLMTLVASFTALLFGILWATLRKDLQGAFGVSGYVGTVCAAIVPLLAWY